MLVGVAAASNRATLNAHFGAWTATGLEDNPASHRGGFERSVVEDIDIIEDVGSGEVSGFVDVFSDALHLQA